MLVFDVNETLSDMAPLSDGSRTSVPRAPGPLWFAELLRDGFALTASGDIEPFATLGAEALRVRLHGPPLDRPLDGAVDHVMEGFSELPVHPDVRPGLRALDGLGIRLVTLSNGSAAVADTAPAGGRGARAVRAAAHGRGRGRVEAGPAAYAHALQECGVEPGAAMLVAVHPWDIDGADARAWPRRGSTARTVATRPTSPRPTSRLRP